MTKRDYETIAECFRQQLRLPWTDRDTAWVIANAMAVEMELDNPRFKRDLFMDACGLKESS